MTHNQKQILLGLLYRFAVSEQNDLDYRYANAREMQRIRKGILPDMSHKKLWRARVSSVKALKV